MLSGKKNSRKSDFQDDPPQDPKITFTDGSAEAIQRDAHKAKFASRALITDEGGRLFGGYALTSDRLLSGLSVFSNLWMVEKLLSGVWQKVVVIPCMQEGLCYTFKHSNL